jgi:hypothetical protein
MQSECLFKVKLAEARRRIRWTNVSIKNKGTGSTLRLGRPQEKIRKRLNPNPILAAR